MNSQPLALSLLLIAALVACSDSDTESCPAGFIRAGDACVCPPGFRPAGQVCVQADGDAGLDLGADVITDADADTGVADADADTGVADADVADVGDCPSETCSLELLARPISTAPPPLDSVTHVLEPTTLWGDLPGPYPTNAWWQSLVLDSGTSVVNPIPYLVRTEPSGLVVSMAPVELFERPPNPWPRVERNFTNDLTLGATEPLTSRQVVDYDDLSVTLTWSGAAGTMTAPLVHGSPYITAVYDDLAPQIETGAAIDTVNGSTTSRVTADRFAVELSDGQSWLLYASAPIELSWTSNALGATSSVDVTLRAARVGEGANAVSLLDAHRAAVATGGTVSASTLGDTATLRFDWEVTGGGDVLIMALPHHLDTLTTAVADGLSYTTLRGALTPVVGNEWVFEEPLTTISWSAPSGIDPTRLDAIEDALEADAQRPAPSGQLGTPYFWGKEIAAWGMLALIADELGRDDIATELRSDMATQLEPWVNQTNDYRLVYDETWGGAIVERGNSFNNGERFGFGIFGQGFYNDQHFHYGYHIFAAAALARGDAAWAEANGDYVRSLIRGIANPSARDPYFTTTRYLDFYVGHSWTSGLFTNEGRNQESTSEAVNAWYGMWLWGLATEDRQIADLGRLLLALEIRSAQTYWQMPEGSTIYPSEFVANRVAGIVRDTGVEYHVFFDPEADNPEFVHGIQRLPFTPIEEELLEPGWIEDEYPVFSAVLDRETPVLEEGWRGFIYMSHAIFDAEAAWDEVQTCGQPIERPCLTGYDNGNSETNTLYWVATRP